MPESSDQSNKIQRRILYVQKPEVLPSQIEKVQAFLVDSLPNITIDYASHPEDVPWGSAYDALICPTIPWLPQLLERIDNAPLLHFHSAGIDKIWDMDFDKSRYIMTKSSGVNAVAMGEFAVGAMLYFAKRFGQFADQSRYRMWKRAWLNELSGRRVVVLGMGAVGRAVAERATAFGMIVDGVRSSGLPIDGIRQVVALANAEDIVTDADYLVVAVPLTEETRGLVDSNLLSRLNRNAVLVDISRGGIIDHNAVIEALDKGVLGGAALDVFEEEPLPSTSPLWGRPDVLLTPHVAGTTPYFLERMLAAFVENAEAVWARQQPPGLVSLQQRY